MRYASKTSVSTEKSEQEIRRLLQKYGATRFASGWEPESAFVQFQLKDSSLVERQVHFVIPLPKRDEKRFTHGGHYGRTKRTPQSAEAAWEQACRQSWRALLLVLKAKLEAVESKIATFEREFLAHIVMADGRTIGDILVPRLHEVTTGQLQLGSGEDL